jgi:mannose-6-phosphate isomerase-like protein (cupin superfamily)
MEHKTVVSRMSVLEHQEVASGEDFHFFRHKFVKGEDGYMSNIAFLRLPPRKAAFPLHYHEYSEETFYIIAGKGHLNLANGRNARGYGGRYRLFPNGRGRRTSARERSETE